MSLAKTKTKSSSSSSKSKKNHNPQITSSIDETTKKVLSTLLPSIQQFQSGISSNNNDDHNGSIIDFDPKKDGLDFLSVKNSLLLSYLIDLTNLLLYQHQQHANANNNNNNNMNMNQDQLKQCMKRLNEMKVIIEKIKPLEKKMRYQIDKLLTVSSTSSSFASSTAANITHGSKGDGDDNKCSDNDDSEEEEEDDDEMVNKNLVQMDESDPLAFRPNLDGFGTDNDDDYDDDDDKEEDGSDKSNYDTDDDEEDDEDEEILAAKEALKSATGRSKKYNSNSHEQEDDVNSNSNNNNNLYKAPRLAATPFIEKEHQNQKQQKQLLRQRQKLQKSELLSTLKESFTELPEEDDMYGGSNIGKQREAAKRLADREAEKVRFEEETFVRLTTSRKEKKMKNRIMREELSTLNSIADIANVTAGISMAFGDKSIMNNDNDRHHDFDGDYGDDNEVIRVSGSSSRHTNGKRRRVDMNNDSEGRGNRNTKGKKAREPKNSFQKALYGMDGGSGGKRKKKK